MMDGARGQSGANCWDAAALSNIRKARNHKPSSRGYWYYPQGPLSMLLRMGTGTKVLRLTWGFLESLGSPVVTIRYPLLF